MTKFKVGDLVKHTKSGDIGLLISLGKIERLVELENNAEWRFRPAIFVKWIDDGVISDFDDTEWWSLEVINESR